MSGRSYTKESTVSKVTCNEIVVSLTGSAELAKEWWYGSNKAFGMRNPIDVPTNEVYDYLISNLQY